MKKWEEVSESARQVMKEMGNFSPTVNAEHKMVKGCTDDGDGTWSTYLDSTDLRNIAEGCKEVADWLDARAES